MEQQSLTIKNGIESIKTNASYNPKELQNCLAVMENHRDEYLELIEKWYKSASQYRNENQQDLGEYFWINDHTFSLPLNHTFKQLKIDLPKDFLLYSYNHPL